MNNRFFLCSILFCTAAFAQTPNTLFSSGVLASVSASLPAAAPPSPKKSSTLSSQDYMEKFNAYTNWVEHIPSGPDPAFLAFIKKPTPLTRKLREKWLYQLARTHSWGLFAQYYLPSTDTTLQCFQQTALYHEGRTVEALKGATPLWLNGGSQSNACNDLFATLLRNHAISDTLILERLHLALEKHNISLARYLLKQLTPPRTQDADLLSLIYQNPSRIMQLSPSKIHGEFYLYGLKQIALRNMDKAIQLFRNSKTTLMLTQAQQQSFLAHVALYKAMRNQKDAPLWFAKIQPVFLNETLLEWEIRYALGHQQWKQVRYLIALSPDKKEPCWQYWSARANEALGDKEKARLLYKTLASTRHYYGFLASLRLHQRFHFQNEPSTHDATRLTHYKPITDQVQNLYASKQLLQASRLLNDFMSELPKADKSALVYWLDHTLQWHGKSVYFSNNEDLSNQLSLRFPLAYHGTIAQHAQHYQIPRELIYAVIRQESAFHSDIVSPAGANGLMQLMPATAKVVAKRASIPYSDNKQLFLSEKNIQIGVAYLQQLAQQFNRHPLLMVAAYNAGPRQVRFWMKNNPLTQIDLWIETLPWRETRNYIKNIIAFYAVYQYRLDQEPNLTHFMKPF